MAGLRESDFTCPIVGGLCRRGCPAAEQAIDQFNEQAVAGKLVGTASTEPAVQERQDVLRRILFPSRPAGSSGRNMGEKCGRSPKKAQ